MADLDFEFDPNSVEPATDFSTLPPGEYVAQITESDISIPKSGNGKSLNLTWQITEGEYENRIFWQHLNYQHSSAQAQEISQRMLKTICDAVGYGDHLTNSEVLHFVPCRVKLKYVPPKNGYSEKNEVAFVKPLQADAPATKTAVTKPTVRPASRQTQEVKRPAAQAPAGQTRPWGNRKTA